MLRIDRSRIAVLFAGAIALAAIQFAPAPAAAQVATPLDDYVAGKAPPEFDTPEQAVDAFKAAVNNSDFDKTAELLGLDVEKAKASPGTMDTFADIQAGVKEKVDVVDQDGHKVLEIGKIQWPLPFPLVKDDNNKWAFDTHAGLEEIADRNVGQNELSTIDTLKAYVDAQEEYASKDRDGDGVLEYAQKIVSSPGKQDGLYWPAEEFGGEESPAGAALADGDAMEKAKAGQGYNGYRYRILTGQGDNIAGGKYSYIINGNMIAGHAAIAWPVTYGLTGVKTFLVSKNGIIYQADLGENTAEIAAKMRVFNPSDEWEIVQD